MKLAGILYAIISFPMLAAVTEATAQSSASSQPLAANDALEEVVVTAERKETSLQTTPAAVSVIGGETLADEQVHTIMDLTSSLPNVTISQQQGQAEIAVRGIGYSDLNPGDEGRVAYYVDDAYIARPSAQLGTFFDVDHVELLRGPQGTLYGRNATGGAFSILTRMPTDQLSGYLNVTAGNYGLIQTEGALSGPLSDGLSGRIAYQTVGRNGYGTNLFDGHDINDEESQALRSKLLWKPSDNLQVLWETFYGQENDSNFAWVHFGPGIPGQVPPAAELGSPHGSQDINSWLDPRYQRRSYGTILTPIIKVSDSITFKTILSYVHSTDDIVEDVVGSPTPISRSEEGDDANQYTAEFQLIGAMGRFNWIAGLYYFHETDFAFNRAVLNTLEFGGPNQPIQGVYLASTLKGDAPAVYGQASYNFTDDLALTVGGRESYERRQALGDTFTIDFRPYPPFLPVAPPAAPYPLNLSKSFDSFTPKASLDYRFTPDVYGYATYSQGFKSGGFNWGSTQETAYFPETVKDYEAGLKSTFFDKRLRANLAVFYYDYKNLQTQTVVTVPALSIITTNASAAHIYGSELDLIAFLTPGLRFDTSLAVLHSEYTDYLTADENRPALGVLNLKGNVLPYAPQYTLNVGLEDTWSVGPHSLTLRGEYQEKGYTYFSQFNLPGVSQSAYGVGNIFLTFKSADEHWSAIAFVRNVGNTFAATNKFLLSSGDGSAVDGAVIAPRTYGATIGYKF